MKRLLLLLCLGLSGCVTPRMVTLADGTKVSSARTYISAKETEFKGRNSYGVPPQNFAFYPAGYAPAKDTGGGYLAMNEQKARETFEAMKKLGRVSGDFKFRPGNTPSWDLSYSDPASVDHDCFSVERLFVVPWGSGEGKIGKISQDSRIQFPSISFNRAGKILVQDIPRKRVLTLDQSGRVLSSVDSSNPPGFDWNIYDGLNESDIEKISFISLSDSGKQSYLVNGGTLYISLVTAADTEDRKLVVVDMKAKTTVCRVYAPPPVTSEVLAIGALENQNPLSVLYPEGYALLPRFTAEGLEIWRYSLKANL